MRKISTETIKETVEKLLTDANYELPESVKNSIEQARDKEQNALAKSVLGKLSENLDAAEKINVPICQDTGMALVFIEIGQDVLLEGESLEDAVNKGVKNAYINGFLRKSVVSDPLFGRKNTDDNTPSILYTKIVKGDRVKISVMPKGFGSENMSALKMFTPSATKEKIEDFIVETIKNAGGNPCPPVIVGVGIGGDFEYCAFLAKKALLRDIDTRNPDENYAKMEEELLRKINNLGIGPQGFGGDTTALGVN
ncbi:MAG: fumarate hydratase, partial [Clostridia bacterium]|nr:fumarate hydratase [Clostridia bacterium]